MKPMNGWVVFQDGDAWHQRGWVLTGRRDSVGGVEFAHFAPVANAHGNAVQFVEWEDARRERDKCQVAAWSLNSTLMTPGTARLRLLRASTVGV